MREQAPEIAKTAARLLAAIETAWTRCARRHKFGVGQRLRDQSLAVSVAVVMAWRDRGDQLRRVRELVEQIDKLKIVVQLAKDIEAFRSFNEFEAIGRLVDAVGRQSGGWLKSLRLPSQNAPAAPPPVQRAPILSSRAAPPSGATR